MPGSSYGIAIRLESCSKTFQDGTVALKSMDFQVEAGETAVMLGPSGCGKTTALRLIAGLESPDNGGRVYFGGKDMTRIPIEKRNVGMVFQSYALFPNMNVEENIAYGLRVRGGSKSEQRNRAREMLEMMQIETLGHRRIDQLSGGQRQRVALARALAVEPQVLLLDEPLTALDAKLRYSIGMEMNALLRKVGITSIYVTHDQGEAMSIGDRILVMDHGEVVQIGKPREIYFTPKSKFVADFIGSMNKLEGSVKGKTFHLPGGKIPWNHKGGGDIEVFFRPESATVVTEKKSNLRGTLVSSLFLGDRTRLFVNGISNETMIVETTERREFREGEVIYLDLPPDSILVLNH